MIAKSPVAAALIADPAQAASPPSPFVWTSHGAATPGMMARRRKVADLLRNSAPDPQNMWQGIQNATGKVAAALVDLQSDQDEKAARESYAQRVADMGSRHGDEGMPFFQDLVDAVASGAIEPEEAMKAALEWDSRTTGQASQESWYGNTVPLQDESGNIVGYGQISNRGNTKQLDFGDGLQPAAPVNYIDTGTGYVPVYRNGGAPVGGLPVQGGGVSGDQQVPGGGAGVIPKDNAGAAFQAGIGGANAKRFDQYMSDAQGAYAAVDVLDAMSQQMADPNFYSGTGAGAVAGLKRVAASLGLDPNGVQSIETFNALANKATLDAIGGSLGTAISDGDRNFIRATMANLDNTPAGNRKIIEVNRALAQRKIEVAQLAARYAQQRGSLDADWPAYLYEWVQQNPLFPGAGQPTGGGASLPDPFGIRGQ